MNLTKQQAAVAAMAVGYSLNEGRAFPEDQQDALVELDAYLTKEVYPKGREESIELLRSTFMELMKEVRSERA